MDLNGAMSRIESCRSADDVRTTFQRIIENLGFASFTFLDSGNAHHANPYFLETAGAWRNTYVGNGFIQVDPYVAKARRFNMPFDWASIPLPAPRRGPKPRVGRLMEAASDFGLREGLVVPYHFKDEQGRSRSSLCVLFWTQDPREFYRVVTEFRSELHILQICFMHRVEALRAAGESVLPGNVLETAPLTDREREVLVWASRGKTSWETAEILGIAELTAQTHMRNAARKLDATNKTHAVARAIMLGLIDP